MALSSVHDLLCPRITLTESHFTHSMALMALRACLMESPLGEGTLNNALQSPQRHCIGSSSYTLASIRGLPSLSIGDVPEGVTVKRRKLRRKDRPAIPIPHRVLARFGSGGKSGENPDRVPAAGVRDKRNEVRRRVASGWRFKHHSRKMWLRPRVMPSIPSHREAASFEGAPPEVALQLYANRHPLSVPASA
jgi:hypothetical protein